MPQKEIKNINQEVTLIRLRLTSLVAMSLLMLALIFCRLIQLQVFYHDHYQLLSDKNRLSLQAIPAKRGIIYDRNGTPLVENIPNFTLVVTPEQTDNIDDTILRLSHILPITQSDIDTFQRELNWHHRYEPTRIKAKLTYDQVAKFYLNRYAFPGVSVISNHHRQYPFGPTMVTVTGYANFIDKPDSDLMLGSYMPFYNTVLHGRTGIEASYNTLLQGQPGYDQAEVDVSGRTVRVLQHQPPQAGSSLTLTIDAKLQATALAALAKQRGAVVVLDPRSGEVLAMVSQPTYDPNWLVSGMTHEQFATINDSETLPMFNRAISGQYPLGSTIKPFIAVGALLHDIIDADFSVVDHGTFQVPGSRHIFHDWKYDGHGITNLHKALIVSCDTFFYAVGVKMGIELMDQTLEAFGLGETTAIDLDGEKSGIVTSPWWKRLHKQQNWYTGDTVNAAIGQGDMLATPLQLAASTAQLATAGTAYKPHLVKSIQHPTGEHYDIPKEQVRTNPIDKQDWKLINQAMIGVISSIDPPGTGFRFGRHATYTVAAKTGTAQVTSRKPKPGEKLPYNLRDDSLFIGYAPADKPTVVISVVVEHDVVASAVARKVLDCYFNSQLCKEPKHV